MSHDWMSCDGIGGSGRRPIRPQTGGGLLATRRSVLLTAAAGLATWAGSRSALADVTVNPGEKGRNVLVVIFLRGGADGLNLVVPYAEDEYYKARPNLAIAGPKDTRAPEKARAIDLNGFFGLHPSLAALLPLYGSNKMTVVHACGSNDHTRSHFEAMATMEHGAPENHSTLTSGWLARHLLSKPGSDSPLRAVSFSETVPDSLRGATEAIAIQSLDDFKLRGGEPFEKELSKIYGGKDLVAHAGQQTIQALTALRSLDPKNYKPSNGAKYPESDLGAGLRQVACLIRADMGLEVACLDKGGWDTHVAQGADTGWQAGLMTDLAGSIVAFCQDLGSEISRVTVVAMSEFGRRVSENAGLGTDHGRAGAMMLFGGGIKTAQVACRWPGLKPEQLDEVGDLRVTTDYRTVLAEVLGKRLGNLDRQALFPGLGADTLSVLA
ncbi:MAG TPA: DUF1501 domain-containing protein [Fimbriimonas sp.]|nr:DUF1501 domain-containing protein [Fimbriimonas sp.]